MHTRLTPPTSIRLGYTAKEKEDASKKNKVGSLETTRLGGKRCVNVNQKMRKQKVKKLGRQHAI